MSERVLKYEIFHTYPEDVDARTSLGLGEPQMGQKDDDDESMKQ